MPRGDFTNQNEKEPNQYQRKIFQIVARGGGRNPSKPSKGGNEKKKNSNNTIEQPGGKRGKQAHSQKYGVPCHWEIIKKNY